MSTCRKAPPSQSLFIISLFLAEAAALTYLVGTKFTVVRILS
jgi:hypothetical protein